MRAYAMRLRWLSTARARTPKNPSAKLTGILTWRCSCEETRMLWTHLERALGSWSNSSSAARAVAALTAPRRRRCIFPMCNSYRTRNAM